jgi:hypothetical protein
MCTPAPKPNFLEDMIAEMMLLPGPLFHFEFTFEVARSSIAVNIVSQPVRIPYLRVTS